MLALLAAIPEVLDATPMTREELAGAVVAATGREDLRPALVQGWGAVLKPAAFRGLLCFGPPRGRSVTFVAPRRWLAGWREVDTGEAVDALALAYVGAYGPADHQAFARWTGLSPALCRAGFTRLAWVDVAGTTGAVPREALPDLLAAAGLPTVVRLLPAFDPYVVGGLRQLDAVATGNPALISRPQGWVSPALVVDGRIEGTWEATARGERLEITVSPFGTLSGRIRAALSGAADALAVAAGAAGARLRTG